MTKVIKRHNIFNVIKSITIKHSYLEGYVFLLNCLIQIDQHFFLWRKYRGSISSLNHIRHSVKFMFPVAYHNYSLLLVHTIYLVIQTRTLVFLWQPWCHWTGFGLNFWTNIKAMRQQQGLEMFAGCYIHVS